MRLFIYFYFFLTGHSMSLLAEYMYTCAQKLSTWWVSSFWTHSDSKLILNTHTNTHTHTVLHAKPSLLTPHSISQLMQLLGVWYLTSWSCNAMNQLFLRKTTSLQPNVTWWIPASVWMLIVVCSSNTQQPLERLISGEALRTEKISTLLLPLD